MPGMKVTLDAAMRARDVSRPHAEHEDQAVAGEPQPARARDQSQDTRDTRGAQPAGSAAADTAPAPAAGGAARGAPKGRPPRRRRRRR
jgi:hypothetical protein